MRWFAQPASWRRYAANKAGGMFDQTNTALPQIFEAKVSALAKHTETEVARWMSIAANANISLD